MTTEDTYRKQIQDAFPELDEIDDTTLRELTIKAWKLGLERGGWKSITDIPYAWNIQDISNVEHVRGVVKIALDAAKTQQDFHEAEPDYDVLIAAALLHDVGKCYEYTAHVDEELLLDPDPTYATDEIPHSLSGYALAHEVGCPIAVQRAIPHYHGEIPNRTLEAELVKSANSASSNAITQSAMGITLQEWIEKYSQVG